MRKIIHLLIIIIGLSTVTKAQIVVEDATGQSSVILQNSNASIDFGALAASVAINNFKNIKYDKAQLLWGLKLRGELTEGLSTLVSGGHVTSGSKLSGFLAYSNNADAKEREWETRITALENQKAAKTWETTSDAEKRRIDNEIAQALSDRIDYRKTHEVKKIVYFLSPFLNSNTFRRYDASITGNLKNRYPKEKFRGGGADAGVNYTYGKRWQFGLSAGLERTNSNDSLESRKSKIRTTTTVGNQTIIDDKEYTVLDGTYAAYTRLNLRTDLLYYGSLDDKNRFVWNTLYGRYYKPLTSKDLINNVLVLGTGINLYKANGKFSGGVYLQCSDVGNTISGEPNVFKRLDFGLNAKYSFSSIFF